MTRNGRIRRSTLVVGFVVAVAFDWPSAAADQDGRFDPNGGNSRSFMLSSLAVRDYPGPRPGSRNVVGAEVVRQEPTLWMAESRFRVGDIVERIGDVPVRGAIHFARLWEEVSSVEPTPVHVRRRGTTIVLRLVRSASTELDPEQDQFGLMGVMGWHATEHFSAWLVDLSPSLQECMNRSRGVLITDVHPDGPGAYAGLRAGDILVRLNGKAFDDRAAADAIVGKKPGTIAATVLRNDREVDLMPFDPAAVRKAALRRSPGAPQPGSDRRVPLLGVNVTDVRGGAAVMTLWRASRGAALGLAVRDLITGVSGVRVTSSEMFQRLVREAARPSTQQLVVSGPTGPRTLDLALPVRRLLDEERTLAESIDVYLESRSDGSVIAGSVMRGRAMGTLLRGDRILSVAGEPAISVTQVIRLIAEWPANLALTLHIVRNEVTQSVVVVPQAVEDRSSCIDCHGGWPDRDPEVELEALSPAFATALGIDQGVAGVLVTNVRHRSNAEARGLRGCDVITRIDGEELPNPLDEHISLTSWVMKNIHQELTVRRDGKELGIRAGSEIEDLLAWPWSPLKGRMVIPRPGGGGG